MKVFVVCVCFFIFAYRVSSKETFIVSFSSPQNWSKDEWVKFKGKIPGLFEFTTCYWEKLDYFPEGFVPVWSYCTVLDQYSNGYKCIGSFYSGDLETANRNINFGGWFEGWGNTRSTVDVVVKIDPYLHRTWSHFCWSYSSKTGSSKLYYNGKLLGEISLTNVQKGFKPPVINGSDDVYDSAFIIGQDQDGIEGHYTSDQAFYGSISELNMWDRILSNVEIIDLSECRAYQKGNVISWQQNEFNFRKVTMSKLKDAAKFCAKQKQMIIFPKPRSLLEGSLLCIAHGGFPIIPQSDEENKLVFDIVSQHKRSCMVNKAVNGINTGKVVWLGLYKYDSTWYDFSQVDFFSTEHGNVSTPSYTKWGAKYGFAHTFEKGCAYINTDGSWGFDDFETCKIMRLCTMCSLPKTPVFTFKGLCNKWTLNHWNYYLAINQRNEIRHYESYHEFPILYYDDGKWQLKTKESKIELKGKNYPVGRYDWDWYDTACGVTKFVKPRTLTFSNCNIASQFTCNDGQCIAMKRRCNNNDDCHILNHNREDNSDEENCSLIQVPKSYRKELPPKPPIANELPIHTTVEITNIDFIDMINMKISITILINMTWDDRRLVFNNLVPNERNALPKEKVNLLWLPSDHLILYNAIIGEVHIDKDKEVYARATNSSSYKMDLFTSYEDFTYHGSNVSLTMRERIRGQYSCIFNLINYPFDRHTCEIIMLLKMPKSRNISLINGHPSVSYVAESDIVSQFKIENFRRETNTNYSEKTTIFITRMTISRNYSDQVKTIFAPTCMLWFLAYLTLFLRTDDLNNRSRISVTILLVLVALLGSGRYDYPKTTYFKFIDLWFFFYITDILLIICHHIFIDTFWSAFNPASTIGRLMRNQEEECCYPFTKDNCAEYINRLLIFLLPIKYHAPRFMFLK